MFSLLQVKRYIDIYLASSLIGFSSEDISRIRYMYTKAERTLTQIKDMASHKSKSNDLSPSVLKSQINTYFNFLTSVAELARSKWTEFNLPMMFVGLGMMLMSLFAHIFAINWLSEARGVSFNPCGNSKISLGLLFASFIVMTRMLSLFSNSYIRKFLSLLLSASENFLHLKRLIPFFWCCLYGNWLSVEEGKVANFLLATIGLMMLRYSMMRQKMLLQVGCSGSLAVIDVGVLVCWIKEIKSIFFWWLNFLKFVQAGLFLILVAIIRFTIEIGLSKQAATSAFLHFNPSWMLGIDLGHPVWMHISELLPVLALMLLVHLLYKAIASGSSGVVSKIVLLGTTISYILIAMQWACENNMLGLVSYRVGRNTLPRIIYAIGFGQILLLAFSKIFCWEKAVVDCRSSIVSDSVTMLSAWSSTVIIVSGQQGPLVALAALVGGCSFSPFPSPPSRLIWCLVNFEIAVSWPIYKMLTLSGYCIVRFHDLEGNDTGNPQVLAVNPLSVTQWSLFAVCLFFCTGHW